MADRFPLIANSSANQIQEIASGDRLDLTGTDVVNLKAAGVVTATTFSGNITGVAATFSGDISADNITASGTLTYEDVTNVDAVGLVTARSGLRVLGAGATVAGVSTFYDDLHVAGVVEKVSAASTYLSGNDVVLELDVTNSTTYRYSMPDSGNIGIVSFKICLLIERMEQL